MTTANKDDDNVSVLTSGSQTSIWSHAAMLLRGEHPDAIVEEESESEKEEENSRALRPEQSLRTFLDANENQDNIDFLQDDPKTMVCSNLNELSNGRRLFLSILTQSFSINRPTGDA